MILFGVLQIPQGLTEGQRRSCLNFSGRRCKSERAYVSMRRLQASAVCRSVDSNWNDIFRRCTWTTNLLQKRKRTTLSIPSFFLGCMFGLTRLASFCECVRPLFSREFSIKTIFERLKLQIQRFSQFGTVVWNLADMMLGELSFGTKC